jgi:hypothetical protein
MRFALFATTLFAGALAAPAAASSGSITDKLSSDGEAIEVTSEPAGATTVHLAVMEDLQGDGIRYLNVPASQTRFVPSPSTPVVDVQAFGPNGPIGGWAGRIQTTPPPAGSTQPAEKPPAESHKEAPGVKETSPVTEAPLVSEPAEPAPAETAASEPQLRQGRRMDVGVDAGGWSWEAAVRDFSGAVKYVRSSFTHYNSDSQMALLAKYGVTLMPLFGTGGTLASYDKTSFLSEIVTWFKRYGKGGSFWKGRAVDLGATTCELINEPGNPYFYPDYSNHTLYASLTRKVKAAFEANFPATVRPKLLVSYDGGFNGSEYGRSIFAAGAVADGVTVHPYGGKKNVEQSALGNRARVTQAHAETGLPVYVTEIGWPTAVGQPPTGDSLQWTERQQAENITGFVRWASQTGYVRAVIDFNYADYGSNDWYGIVNSTGARHKLSYAALKADAGSY